ncbi:MAG: hypothetical protein ACTSPD_14635 [Promethearchaeota archaeon]
MIDIIFTILLNALPLIILIVPLLFIWKKTIGKFYLRIVLGIIVFYLIYWVMPIIFQIGTDPNELVVEEKNKGNISLGVCYIAAHMGSLIVLFALYPLVALPFIFFVAPFIALLFVWNHLRKQDGTIRDNLNQLTYELKESPYNRIIYELNRNDWSREKEILKLMIVLLPISLYLLQVILDISNLQTVSLTEGTTALGWFIEILFVYLATFIFSIELLFSSQIALKGRYFGESIREQTYKSLYQVGAPISILSLILFVIQYTESIGIIIYFFAYFIMASIIFVLFLKIFEPISILIFIKLINWWKNREKNRQKINYTNFYYALLFSVLGLIIYFVINMLLSGLIILPIIGDPNIVSNYGNFSYKNPSLYQALTFELLIIFGNLLSISLTIILMIFLAISLKYVKSILVGIIMFLPIIIIMAISLSSEAEYWLTGQVSYTTIFNFNFYTFRSASFDASFSSEGEISLLAILAFPYLYTRYIFNVIILGLIIYYIGKEFKRKSIPTDEKNVEKIIFSNISEFFSLDEYLSGTTQFLISKNKNISLSEIEKEREEVKSLLNLLEEDKLLKEIMPSEEDEKKRFYFTLKYLFFNRIITIWKPEFSFIFERVEKQALYVMYTDGRDVFSYPFNEETQQDPALISGMFSAITSFIKETTHSTQALKIIDHGDISIMIEYGNHIFCALFIKGKQSSELRAQMKEFVNQFEAKHSDVLVDWNGSLSHFKDDHLMVEKIFIEEE